MISVYEQIALRPRSDVAILADGLSITYGTLLGRVGGAVSWLLAEGVSPGDVVALRFVDSVKQIYFSIALMRVGAIQAALDPRLEIPEFLSLSSRIAVQVIVTDTELPSFPDIVTLYPPPSDELEHVGRDPGFTSGMGNDDVAILSHGSGTTGTPKIMPLKHRHIAARCSNYSPDRSILPGEKIMILHRHTTLTYFLRAMYCLKSGGCLVEVSAMRNGSTGYLDLLFDALDRYSVEHLHCTAFHAKAITQRVARTSDAGVRFPGLRDLYIGASTVSRPLYNQIVEHVSPCVTVNYGTNEAGTISRADPTILKAHPDSVGIPTPMVKLKVVDPHGNQLGPGKEGMILVCGPCVIDGYWSDEQATAKAFQEGWFRTGDIGYVNKDGTIYLLGRSDDMMIFGGTNVYPVEIERVIEQIPQVKEAAVLPVYSDLGKDRIVAFVALRAPCTATHIIETCRRALGWKSPEKIFFLKTLPRNFAGKVLRRELAKLVQKS